MDTELYEPDFAQDAAAASEWARKVLADPAVVFFDTETTGLGSDAEIIEAAVLAPDGRALFNGRFRPAGPIPRDATRIHGIRDSDVAGAPTFAARWDELRALLAGRIVVTYNAIFDLGMVQRTCARYGLPALDDLHPWECAMEHYAAWYGEWSDYHGHYKWVSLAAAAWETGTRPDHSALGDARACLAVVQKMAASHAQPM